MMIILQKQCVNNNIASSCGSGAGCGSNNSTIVSRTSTSSNATTVQNDTNNNSSFMHNIKRMSIIDRGKVWARQLINKKQPQQQTSTKNTSSVSKDIHNSSILNNSLLTASTASLLLSTASTTTTNAVDSSASSLSISLTTNSSAASPLSLSPISKRISLIQVSPQNYYYYQHGSIISNNTLDSYSHDIQSPQDENGYLIPITIIDLSEVDNKNHEMKHNSCNLRRQSSMKIENRPNKRKDHIINNNNRIQLRKKSFNDKDDLHRNSNLKQQLLKKTRRFSDLSFNNSTEQKTRGALPLIRKVEINNLTANTTSSSTANHTVNSQKLYNICEVNNDSKFDDIKRNLNNYVDNNKKCLISNSKVILTKLSGNNRNAMTTKHTDDSIIYIDSIDNIDLDKIENSSTTDNSDTSGFMTTSSNSSNGSCCNRCGNSLKKQKPSLKIRVDNHDYHAIDEYDSKQSSESVANRTSLMPPLMPPPPPPPLTNSIDSLDYVLKMKKQQQNADDIANCYEKSWENSTNFLIDKLLNKYNHQQNFLHINNNSTSSSSSGGSLSGTSSSVNSNRNSSSSVITSIHHPQQLLSPTNTLSSTSSFKLFVTNNNNMLVPPQIPPPPLPLTVDTTTPTRSKKVKSRKRDEGRHLIQLSNNYDDKDVDLIIFDENKFSPSTTIDSKNSSLCLSDIDNCNELEDLHEIWYQPTISRETVQTVLSALEVGAFLIRYSNSCKDCFALSIRVPYFANPTGVAHYLITKNENGYKLKGVEKEFKSLKSLITHYSVMQEILPVTLNLNFTMKNANMIGNQCVLSENHTKQLFDNLSLIK